MLLTEMKKTISLLIILLTASFALSGCLHEDLTADGDSTSGSSTGTTSGGTALPYGGYTYNFTCPSGVQGSPTIPPTSSQACAGVYENYAFVFSCNRIDDFASAQSSYESCLATDIAACASASGTDPNC